MSSPHARTPPPQMPSRVHFIIARAAPTIVVLQRKRAKKFHVFTIDARTLAVEHGSWFTGKLYSERCDVSFDGRYMVYLALGHGGAIWNGVCRLPWLTTLAEGRSIGTWGGGGYFAGQGLLMTNGWRRGGAAPATDQPGQTLPFQFSPLRPANYSDTAIITHRLQRDGFARLGPDPGRSVQRPGRRFVIDHTGDDGWGCRPSARHPLLTLRLTGYEDGRHLFAFQLERHPGLLDGATWAGWDCLGALWVAEPGRIARFTQADLRNRRPSFSLDVDMFEPPQRSDRTAAGDGA